MNVNHLNTFIIRMKIGSDKYIYDPYNSLNKEITPGDYTNIM